MQEAKTREEVELCPLHHYGSLSIVFRTPRRPPAGIAATYLHGAQEDELTVEELASGAAVDKRGLLLFNGGLLS